MGLSLNNKPFIFPQLQRIFWSASEGALASALIAAGGSKGLMAFQVGHTFIALCTNVYCLVINDFSAPFSSMPKIYCSFCFCILGRSADLRTSGMHFLVVLVLRLLEAAQNCRDGRDWRHNRHRHEIGKFRMWPLWLLLHRSHYKVSQMVKSHSSQLITASIVEFNCAMKWRLCLTLNLQNELERVVEAFWYIRKKSVLGPLYRGSGFCPGWRDPPPGPDTLVRCGYGRVSGRQLWRPTERSA